METSLRQPNATERNAKVALRVIFFSYLVVGLTAFGMAILQKLKALVTKNRWLSEEEMDEGLALVQLYPGPIMVDFAAYVGYRLRGVPGAVLAAAGFILPTLVLMLVLSALYFAAGALPWVHEIFVGLEAVVVGILFHVTIDMGQRAIKHRVQALVMLSAFVLLLFKVNAVLIVIAALAAGALFIRTNGGNEGPKRVHSPGQALDEKNDEPQNEPHKGQRVPDRFR